MHTSVTFVLVVVLLISATVVQAQGQETVSVCHREGNSSFTSISVAGPALNAHLAHGDLEIGVDVDANCAPLWAQAGCFKVGEAFSSSYYYPMNGSPVEYVGLEYMYFNTQCTARSTIRFLEGTYLLWAADLAAATARCSSLLPTPNTVAETSTSHLFICRD